MMKTTHLKKVLMLAAVMFMPRVAESSSFNPPEPSAKTSFFLGTSRVLDTFGISRDENLMRDFAKQSYTSQLQEESAAANHVRNLEYMATVISTVAGTISDPKVLVPIVLTVAGTYSLIQLSNEITPLLFKTKPRMVTETSLPENLWQYAFGKPAPKSRRVDMVYNKTAQKAIGELMETTRQAIYRKRPIKNMFLHGEPGTGKTFAAKEIALNSGAHYVVVNCANFFQLPEAEAITEFKKALSFAHAADRPIITILEEVDALFPRRESASDINRKLTNTFIAEIAKPSDVKKAYILTSNLYSIDSAILSRISAAAIVHVDKPDEGARESLFKIYIKANLEREFPVEGRLRHELKTIAGELEGWTGRDIEQLTLDIADRIHLRDDKTVRFSDFQAAIRQANANRSFFTRKAAEAA